MSTQREQKNIEVRQNYEFFKTMLPSLIEKHGYGKFALLRKKQLIGIFDSADDAIKAARLGFEDGMFSVQEVTDLPINLGFYSYVTCQQ
jgi:hypothetical protein